MAGLTQLRNDGTPKQTGGLSVSPHLTVCGFFGEDFLHRGMFYDYGISLPKLVITIYHSDVALSVQMNFTPESSPDSFSL